MHPPRCLVLIAVLGQVAPALAFESWIEQRNEDVVRQKRDFSCGLAALATLLNYSYSDAVSEDDLLQQLGSRAIVEAPEEAAGVSFADLAFLARSRAYHARGYAVAARHLHAFQRPLLVHLRVAGRSHFSVLRRASEAGDVWLADPSWGNRRLAAWEFRRLFQPDGGSEKGRVLLVVPVGPVDVRKPHLAVAPADDVFTVHIAPALP